VIGHTDQRVTHLPCRQVPGPAHDQRDVDALLPRLLLVQAAVRPQHVAVIGGKDKDRVPGQPQPIQGLGQAADVAIQGRHVGVIAGDGRPICALDVGTQLDLFRRIHVQERLRHCPVRVVGRSPRQEKTKRLVPEALQERDGLIGLDVGVVAGLALELGRVILEPPGVEIVVVAVIGCPIVVKAVAPAARWSEHVARDAVEVPFAHVAGAVAVRLEDVGDAALVFRQAQVVGDAAAGPGVPPGQQGSAAGRADRRVGNGIAKEHPLGGHLVEVKRVHVFRAHAAHRRSAHLVGKDVQDVWLLCHG
jgi:hypothetical protein